MAIADLPDWGEVRVFVGSRPMTRGEREGCRDVVDACLREWGDECRQRAGTTPLVAPVETFMDQVIAFGYAAQTLSSGDCAEAAVPYLMTGADFDPFMDRLYLFAQRQTPAFMLEADDALFLPSGPAPFVSALVPAAERGELGRTTLVITGGPISRWKALGALHPLGADEDYYHMIREALVDRDIMLL